MTSSPPKRVRKCTAPTYPYSPYGNIIVQLPSSTVPYHGIPILVSDHTTPDQPAFHSFFFKSTSSQELPLTDTAPSVPPSSPTSPASYSSLPPPQHPAAAPRPHPYNPPSHPDTSSTPTTHCSSAQRRTATTPYPPAPPRNPDIHTSNRRCPTSTPSTPSPPNPRPRVSPLLLQYTSVCRFSQS